MNISLSRPEHKSRVFPYLLVALAIFTMLSLTLNIDSISKIQLSIPSTTNQTTSTDDDSSVSAQPLAIHAPMPPAENSTATPTPESHEQTVIIHQAIPAPMP